MHCILWQQYTNLLYWSGDTGPVFPMRACENHQVETTCASYAIHPKQVNQSKTLSNKAKLLPTFLVIYSQNMLTVLHW